jgi:hypothetical protein
MDAWRRFHEAGAEECGESAKVQGRAPSIHQPGVDGNSGDRCILLPAIRGRVLFSVR